MGFPNVDIFVVTMLLAKFTELQMDPEFVINDTFEDLDAGRKAEIGTYLSRKTFETDIRKRGDNQIFILEHFPLLDMPLPQIGITLGQEGTADKFLGDCAGEATPYPTTGTPTHWDIPKVYIGHSMYRIDVVAATKAETIWLSRLIQRFLCEEQDALAEIGVFEFEITLADLKLEQDQLPQTIFNRAVQINCKVQNSWTKRIPINTYQTGNNLAL